MTEDRKIDDDDAVGSGGAGGGTDGLGKSKQIGLQMPFKYSWTRAGKKILNDRSTAIAGFVDLIFCMCSYVSLFMVALCNRVDHIYFHPVVSSFFFFFLA